ncbi:thiol:disulfide interchange protein (periplasmic) [Bordetella ansorpii]|uniref:Thiol:disulfide interchange protein (Periplasmic) n=1 Tax=Bordetella ansorpii TaxID=288768 RepID=A0A157RF02_9BORD|nr:thioredoxin fold domain-containing protein [Bordetella ansorpii]SAI56504.1 thiol:disulfide interchange protein (periplasmic) [Bordetella ansorpii]
MSYRDSNRVRAALAAVAVSIAGFVGYVAEVRAQSWPKVQARAEAVKVLAAFKRGPYGDMARDRVARQTPVSGIYALMDPAGKYGPIFTDEKISRMKNGNGAWLDVASGKPLGTRQVQAMRRDMAARIDTAGAITVRYGNGGKDAILVSAYDCPYCEKLEMALDKSKVNADVHVFPMSLQHNQAGPMGLARDIWCSADPAKAWKTSVLQGIAPEPAPAGCNKDARDTSMLMLLFDLKAVPARIHADGRVSQFRIQDL